MVEEARIRKADNGYVLSYTKKEEMKAVGKAASSPYSEMNYRYEECSEVFTDDQVEAMVKRIEALFEH